MEIEYNKPHSSLLLYLQDKNTPKVINFFLQEITRDVIFRPAEVPRRQEELQLRNKDHLLSVGNKIRALLEYKGVLTITDSLSFLQRIIHSLMHG